jgi:gliding motility-associated protein GldM
MAGGKETPRQKMIGMMYLVLTAMLALQVSSALLEKFQLLNNSMEQSSNSANKINGKTVESIREQVKKSGNRSFELAIVNQAEEVRKMSSAVVNDLEALKTELLNTAGGGKDEMGKIKNASEEEKVAIMMIGATKQGKAYELKSKLNDFVSKLNKVSGQTFATLANDGKDDQFARLNPDQARKDFAELNFAQTPVPAAMAVLSQKQSEVRRLEGEVLDVLASKVGAKDIKFDKILAMISAESNVVVAGTKFKGEMFIAASSSALVPRMSLNGSSLPVTDGKGKIEFTAQGGGTYDKDGLSARTLNGSISFPTPSGRDTTVSMKYDYKIAKPTYNIESGTMPPLFLDCKNVLSVQSPALGSLWNPSFTGSGASFSSGGQKGKVIIVPNSKNVTMNIVNGGNTLGSEPFRVNRVPRPRVEILINGASYDERRGVQASMIRSITVKIIADESLQNYSPEDANYRAGEVLVNLARGNRRIDGVSLSGAGGSISKLGQQASGGDRLVIEVSGVQRRNFRGEIKDAGMGTELKTINLY